MTPIPGCRGVYTYKMHMCATLYAPQSSFQPCMFIIPHIGPTSPQMGNHGQRETGLFPRPHSSVATEVLPPSPVFYFLHTGPRSCHRHGHAPSSPWTHRDREVVPHVLPQEAAPYGLDGPAPLPWLVSVQVPPGRIQDTEQPESCEQEPHEDDNGDLGWGGKQEPSMVRGLRGRRWYCPP